MTLNIRKHYDPSIKVQFFPEGESLTHQSMADECDINKIMEKWQKTGILDHTNTFEGQYGDFTDVPSDYHDAMNQVLEANDMFATLPSSIRKKFMNDPGQFLDFVENPENREEMQKLGLIPDAEKRPLVEPADRPTQPKPEKTAEPKAEKPAEK
ncbi:internal scaffolding protein [Microviridae sp.]|nr:internal scaffolding protein [Microviridae sp.]